MDPIELKKRAIKKFWRNVDVGSFDECWIWKGTINPDGYGIVSTKGKYFAHRFAMEIALKRNLPSPNRQLNGGKIVRHTCDNPACVNPCHLTLGYQSDNIRDRDSRKRTSIGEHRYNHKLTKSAVLEIRKTYVKSSREFGMPALARRFGVDHSTIDSVLKWEVWKHVK